MTDLGIPVSEGTCSEHVGTEKHCTRELFAVGTLIDLIFDNSAGKECDEIYSKVTAVSDSETGPVTFEGVGGTMVFGGTSIEPGTLVVFRFGKASPNMFQESIT